MTQLFEKLLKGIPPLERPTNPNLACAIGFLFGGVGLAIYFRSLVDLFVPIAITIAGVVAYSALGAFGWLVGAVVAALYGYYRALTSNQHRADPAPKDPAPAAG
jgi:hypothetical protein